MPSQPPFTVVNLQGLFTRRERRSLDASLEELFHIGLLMGDSNYSIWLSPSSTPRWWHQPLAASKVIDPAIAIHPGARVLSLSTRKGLRLDAIFASSDIRGTLTPKSYRTLTFPFCGDHDAVHLQSTLTLPTSPRQCQKPRRSARGKSPRFTSSGAT